VLHHQNKDGQTLLKILISQDNNLKVFRDILVKMEKIYHRDLKDYIECLKNNLGTSDFTMAAVKEGRAGVNFINVFRVLFLCER
jgi:hypothetical protein